MKSKLEMVTNAAILVVCVLLSAVLVQRLLNPAEPTYGPQQSRPTYQVGEHVGDLAAAIGEQSAKTLLMYISPSCRFCTDSMPFYRQLSASRKESGFSLIAIGREPEEGIKAYLAQHNVEVDKVVTIVQPFKLAGTPTLLLLDRDKNATGVWRGLLPSTGEKEVVALLRKEASN